MRILLMSGVTSYMKGGVPIATARLAQGLVDAGHQPALLADAALAGTEQIPLFHLDYPQNEKMAGQIESAVEAFSPDVCHVVSAGVKMLDAVAAALGDRTWAMTIHSIPPAERKFEHAHGNDRLHYICRNLRYLPNAKLWRQMLARGQFARAIVHSDYVLDTAVRYGCAPGKLINIPLGVDLPPSASRTPRPMSISAGPNIVTVGGIAHTKGLHDFLAALPTIRQKFPAVRYRMIGEVRDHSYLHYLQQLIHKLGLTDCVAFSIAASHEEKSAALDEADLYVQPSHEEGFCLSYIEAAPIVPRLLGADTGAIAAISDQLPCAKVVSVKGVQSLTTAALELLTEPVPQNVFVSRVETLKKKYTPEQYVQSHLKLYEQLATVPFRKTTVMAHAE